MTALTDTYSQKKVILAQGPNPDGLIRFYRFLLEQDVKRIIMVTSLIEEEKKKCAPYIEYKDNKENMNNIPLDINKVMSISNLHLKSTNLKYVNDVPLDFAAVLKVSGGGAPHTDIVDTKYYYHNKLILTVEQNNIDSLNKLDLTTLPNLSYKAELTKIIKANPQQPIF